MLQGHRDRRLAVKGHLAGEHLVHHHAHRVQIALLVGHLAPGLLRREVVHAAQGRAGGAALVQGGGLAGLQPGDAEVGHLHPALVVHQYVLGLDVPVHDAVSMGVVHRRQYADRHADGGIRVDRAALADHLLERLAVHVLHHDVAHVAVDAHVQHVHDVLVGDLAGRLGLAAEPAHEFLVGFVLRAQHLDGHDSVFLFIKGAIDDGHAAGSHDGLNDISPRYDASDHLAASSPIIANRAVILSAPPFSSATETRLRSFSSQSPSARAARRISCSSA